MERTEFLDEWFFVGGVIEPRHDDPVIYAIRAARQIRVGDRFDRVFEYVRTREDVMEGRPLPPPSDVREVDLTVVAISMYSKAADSVPQGYTAGIHLVGTGLEWI